VHCFSRVTFLQGLVVIVVALLSACDKPTPVEKLAAEKTIAEKTVSSAFQRNGEMLSVNVENMPRQAFINEIAGLTGAQITIESDENPLVTVQAADISLRKLLGVVVADAPYSITMQYVNLQDSFPASVAITRYQPGVQIATAQPAEIHEFARPTERAATVISPVAVDPAVQEEPLQPDITAMQPEEQTRYFFGQSKEDQLVLVAGMQPTSLEAELMARLMLGNVASEVKIAMLDSLSGSEYAISFPALKNALDVPDTEVVIKAVEVFAELGSDRDIPALKRLAETSRDEDVRNAVDSAIETLQPE
jgi:hypothetical protein